MAKSYCHAGQVTIVGAGNVGATLAQRIVERNVANVVLIDIVEGLPQGIALDLMQAQASAGHSRKITGTNHYSDTAGSDLVVITAGLPRKPGMNRDDLLEVNGRIVIETTQQAIAHSPEAHIIVVTNPLDVMAYLAWEVSGLSSTRVMGMAGVLDSARFQTFISMELGVPPQDVAAMVLGGHGDLMVPLVNYSTVNGIPLAELLDRKTLEKLVDRTRQGGAEIVKLLQRGGAYYAPASSVCVMVEAILNDQSRILPVAAYLEGQFGLENLYLGVPCRLGRAGVEKILELSLNASEQEALEVSARSVKENVAKAKALLL